MRGLKIGDSDDKGSSAVAELQRALNAVAKEKLRDDGLFGSATRGAVLRFQQSRGLPITGEASADVLRLLSAHSKAKLPVASQKVPAAPSVETLAKEIVRAASGYVGLYEVKSNTEWAGLNKAVQDAFKNRLRRVDWQPSWAYCMSFSELALLKAYDVFPELSHVSKFFESVLVPSVMGSYTVLAEKGYIAKSPSVGAIMFMQNGTGWKGHSGIVTGVDGNTITTIEANTSPAPAAAADDREGDGVYRRTRTLTPKKTRGLWIRGFLPPTLALT